MLVQTHVGFAGGDRQEGGHVGQRRRGLGHSRSAEELVIHQVVKYRVDQVTARAASRHTWTRFLPLLEPPVPHLLLGQRPAGGAQREVVVVAGAAGEQAKDLSDVGVSDVVARRLLRQQRYEVGERETTAAALAAGAGHLAGGCVAAELVVVLLLQAANGLKFLSTQQTAAVLRLVHDAHILLSWIRNRNR